MIVEAIRRAQRIDFRIVHFSIQRDHMHLIIEADSAVALESGMKGLVCRLARSLNRVWSRIGCVFPERYHDVTLQSLAQVRNALVYVLNNHRKHNTFEGCTPGMPDLFSSGRYFDGWIDYTCDWDPGAFDAHVATPCWKIAVGWKRNYALIGLGDVPGV